MIRMVGGPLECMSKKQPLTASHTQEAEYIEMAIGQTKAKSAINFLIECGFPANDPIPTFEDNMAACKLATEHINTSRSKQIQTHAIATSHCQRERNERQNFLSILVSNRVATGRHVHKISVSTKIRRVGRTRAGSQGQRFRRHLHVHRTRCLVRAAGKQLRGNARASWHKGSAKGNMVT